MPHDSSPSADPVPLTLSLPPRPARGLTDDLVRPISGALEAEVLDLAVPDIEVAKFLVRIAHGDSGFVARTDSGERAVAIVAATTAALMGDDIPAALANPDVAFLRGLKPEAVEALRGVLLAVETSEPGAVNDALRVLRG
ncbi:hypothetical protein H0264_01650 [Nocardia huaxiensis]|uniref:Uncharacterized protein n=1 Tax=Nocardia huaxiensis TaxID=2755382 RepID=A0A7D6ZAS0_9NOCA|nr:hypothetical protein [Nocardia huaxiensis]QLY31128.1 hypothetical protein H0264_01650 [Nocardia huaxiensis]